MRHRTGTIHLPRRFLVALGLVLGLTILDTWVVTRLVGDPVAAVAFACLLIAPTAVLVNGIVLRPVRALLVALGDGLLSFAERDYGVRIALPKAGDLGELITRFNRLGDLLKEEHNDLYQRELVLETVFDVTPSCVLLANEGGRIVLANSLANARVGEVLAAKRLEGLVLDEVLDRFLPGATAALATDGDVLITTDRLGDAETYGVTRRYFTLSTQQHTLVVLRTLGRELAQKEAEVWKKAIRVISHELNNSLAPITSLTHSARLILNNPEHAHRLTGVFDTIEERATHLKHFLEGYARLAKLPRPTPRSVAWGDFLAKLQKLYSFRLAGTPPDEPGWFDPAQLEQVVINLLKNAVESSSPPDEIALEVTAQDGGTELRVVDRGKGMTDEVLRNAVLPFYSTKKTGSGLGLALCRDIVDAHGGRLAITPRDGGGTAVSVWLPEGTGR